MYKKLAAVALLVSVAGCASLENRRIESPDDRRISDEVRALLRQHPALEPPNSVTVQTIDRVVYLHGLVGTPYQKELAEAVAVQARGKARVVNLVSVDNNSR